MMSLLILINDNFLASTTSLKNHTPKKSTMTRPSEALPAGLLKNVMPKGGFSAGNAAKNPPVSVFESPKLNIPSISHLPSHKYPKITSVTTAATTTTTDSCPITPNK